MTTTMFLSSNKKQSYQDSYFSESHFAGLKRTSDARLNYAQFSFYSRLHYCFFKLYFDAIILLKLLNLSNVVCMTKLTHKLWEAQTFQNILRCSKVICLIRIAKRYFSLCNPISYPKSCIVDALYGKSGWCPGMLEEFFEKIWKLRMC